MILEIKLTNFNYLTSQAFASVLIMFLINWGYALANISVALLVYIYIGQANPGLSKGKEATWCQFFNVKCSFINIWYIITYRLFVGCPSLFAKREHDNVIFHDWSSANNTMKLLFLVVPGVASEFVFSKWVQSLWDKLTRYAILYACFSFWLHTKLHILLNLKIPVY